MRRGGMFFKKHLLILQGRRLWECSRTKFPGLRTLLLIDLFQPPGLKVCPNPGTYYIGESGEVNERYDRFILHISLQLLLNEFIDAFSILAGLDR